MGGGAPITKTGAGTLDLTNANTFGGMVINGGTVRVNNITALGPASSNVQFEDGTTLATTANTARVLTYNYVTNGNFTLGQASGGTGAVTLAGNLEFERAAFGRSRSTTGRTRSRRSCRHGRRNHQRRHGHADAKRRQYVHGRDDGERGHSRGIQRHRFGPAGSSNTTVTSGATLQVSGSITINEKINLNGTGSTGSNGAIRKTGNNTTAIQGQLTGSGSIAMTTGTLRLTASPPAAATTRFTGPITVTGGGTLRFEFIVPNQLGTG